MPSSAHTHTRAQVGLASTGAARCPSSASTGTWPSGAAPPPRGPAPGATAGRTTTWSFWPSSTRGRVRGGWARRRPRGRGLPPRWERFRRRRIANQGSALDGSRLKSLDSCQVAFFGRNKNQITHAAMPDLHGSIKAVRGGHLQY